MRTPILLLALASLLNAQSIQEESKANRMAKEQSPYLRQHAQDPVDWYPWGEAAFDKARKEGKPIFLSIGYAACHWCHVMQRESFQDEEVARVLNEHVVAIKLDREERPDVDRVYLDACHAVGRRGGWPLSAFLTPDREPFYVATYIERDAFLELCQNVRQAWNDTERRQALVDYGKSLTARMRDQARGHPQTAPAAEGELPGDPLDPTDRAIIDIPDPSLLADAARTLLGLEDKAFGGFAPEPHAPKFPNPSSPLFLLRHSARRGGTDSAEASGVRRLLDALLRGGIRDHLAGGFHRYSTDREWKVPHFEKMLYDQALIAVVLLEGWQMFGDPAYRDAVRETLDFCLADMRTTEGGFIAAFDADADHEEGLTYVWRLEELTRILNLDERDVVIPWAGATEEGNWELGRNILWASRSLSDVAQDLGIPPEEASTRWESARGKLHLARAAHPQPRTDTKVLTEWNGLMVSALARAGAAFSDAGYVQEAVRTMTMVKATLRQKDGTYRRSFAGGTARHPAELADYGALLVACLDLHEATLDARWLVEARELASVIDQRFSLEGGGLVDSRAEDLIVETSSIFDGAKPSGISLTLVGLARLGVLTGDPQPLLRARRLAASIERPLLRAPHYSAHALIGLDLLHHPAARVSMHGPVAASLLEPLRRTYMPFAFITREAGSEGEPQSSVVVCVGTRCLEPATAPDAVLERVRQVLDGQ